jgi:hypothetical protein
VALRRSLEEVRIVWLFSFVLGYSRPIWARFALHQDMQTVLHCTWQRLRRSAASRGRFSMIG